MGAYSVLCNRHFYSCFHAISFENYAALGQVCSLQTIAVVYVLFHSFFHILFVFLRFVFVVVVDINAKKNQIHVCLSNVKFDYTHITTQFTLYVSV